MRKLMTLGAAAALIGVTSLNSVAQETGITPAEMEVLNRLLSLPQESPIAKIDVYREDPETGKQSQESFALTQAAVPLDQRCLNRYEPAHRCEEGAISKKVWCQAPNYDPADKKVQVDMFFGSTYLDTYFFSCSDSNLSSCARDKLCGATLPEK